MRIFVLVMCLFLYSQAVKPKALQYSGVTVEHTYSNGKKEKIKIKRDIDFDCQEFGISVDNFTKEGMEKISKLCKKTFITTKGSIQPLFINDKIKTFAENELLYFIYDKASKDSNYVVVDVRKPAWFDFGTIPSSINVPFEDLTYDEDFIDEYKAAYAKLGLKVLGKDKFDFTNAKTAVFFCNGPWCPLSSKMIKHLTKLGYPENKMIWYRGGVSSWQAVALPITKTIK